MVVRIGQRLAPMLPWGGDRVGGGSGGGGWGSEINSGLLNMRRHSLCIACYHRHIGAEIVASFVEVC